MNAEAIITALVANLGDPQELARRAEAIEPPPATQRATNAFKRKFMLLGKAVAHKNVLDFLKRLRDAMEAEKAQNQQKKDGLDESQYKGPTGKHLRTQCFYPSSFTPSISMGGVRDAGGKNKKKGSKALEDQLDKALNVIEEMIVKHGDNTALAADQGKLVVDDELVIDNHADILRVLVTWFVDNRPEVFQSALEGIANMVKAGAVFR